MRNIILLVILTALPVAAEPLFLDVTAQAGLSGGGHAAWGDYDGDGWVDVLIGANLYRNEAGKRFVLVNEAAGLTATGDGGVWGDCDNDGDLDLFLWDNAGQLFLNDGDGTFTKGALPTLPTVVSRGACWADLNGDGLLDLYVGGYEVWEKEMYPDVILFNRGDGRLTEQWRTPARDLLSARGVTAADYDEDGDSDVYVSNYRLQPNLLWRNDGEGGLAEVAVASGVAGNLKESLTYLGGREYPLCGHTIGSAWGDLDNDGHLDLFVGNFSHPPAYQDRPQFLRNLGGPDWRFADMSARAGLQWQESFASPALGDFDNDGRLDLYFTTVYKGDHSVPYRNEGDWRFKDVTAEAGIVAELTYQAAWADYDNDGDLDLMTGGKLYQNQTAGNSWLKVRLLGAGSAIGAQVRVRDGEKVLTRQVEAGTGEGNQNELTLHFGLGARTRPVELEVLWPGGNRTGLSTEINRLVTIRR
ncbi:MAG: CRTAC1 family protein [Armatimonadia bacterium]